MSAKHGPLLPYGWSRGLTAEQRAKIEAHILAEELMEARAALDEFKEQGGTSLADMKKELKL